MHPRKCSSICLLSLTLLRLIPDATASVAPPRPLSPPPSRPEEPIGPPHKGWSAASLHTLPPAPCALPLHPLMQVPTGFQVGSGPLVCNLEVEPPTPFSPPPVPSVQGPCSLRMRAEHPLCPKPSLRPGPYLLRKSSLKDSHDGHHRGFSSTETKPAPTP